MRSYLGILLVALLAAPAGAYDHPLSSYEVRDAYFLGTDSSLTTHLLADYIQTMPAPQSAGGPYVAQIEVLTPYAQVVARSRGRSLDYSAQQAEQDYRKNPDTVQVRVRILYPLRSAATPLQPPPACQGARRMNNALDCFRDFRFHFSQAHPLHPEETYGVPIYSLVNDSTFSGGDVWFVFPADEVASAPLRVTVTNPEGREASATFDLAKLL